MPFLLIIALLFRPVACPLCEQAAWLTAPPHVAPADVIVMLGGDANRLDAAVGLYVEGLAPAIWITGAADPTDPAGESARRAQTRALDLGVPAAAITLLPTRSTWEDGAQIAAAVADQDVASILVVTSWYHGRRALCAIRHHLGDRAVQVYYQPVATPGVDVHNWWLHPAGYRMVNREWSKLVFYGFAYGLRFWAC